MTFESIFNKIIIVVGRTFELFFILIKNILEFALNYCSFTNLLWWNCFWICHIFTWQSVFI